MTKKQQFPEAIRCTSTLARFVIRPSTKGQGDLLLGVMIKTSGVLKPDRVYELREVMGVAVLVDVGPSAIRTDPKKSLLHCSWAWTVNDILDGMRGRFVLTVAEAEKDNAHSSI